MVGRGHLLVPHGRLGDVVGRIVALGSAVTAANAWLLEFLLIAAFIALIMAELCSSSAALGPTIFVLMLFSGVSTTMTTMPSKSVIARVLVPHWHCLTFKACNRSWALIRLRS